MLRLEWVVAAGVVRYVLNFATIWRCVCVLDG